MNGHDSPRSPTPAIQSRSVVAAAALGTAVALAILAMRAGDALTATAPPPVSTQQADWPPIIDMHAHWQPGVTAETLLRNMQASHVQKVAIMPNQGHPFDAALDLQRGHPQQVLAFVGFQNRDWIQQRPEFLGRVEEALRTRQFKGLGEVLLRHYAIPQRQAPEISIAADSPAALKVLELAARFQVPVVLHLEVETEPVSTVQQLTNALDQVRGRGLEPVVIWAHAGGTSARATAQLVEAVLVKYPNLHIDVSSRSRVYPRTTPIIDDTGTLMPEWKALLIKYQDRVFVGSDAPFHDLWNRGRYVDLIKAQRDILRQLPHDVAEKIGYRNAQKLLRLE